MIKHDSNEDIDTCVFYCHSYTNKQTNRRQDGSRGYFTRAIDRLVGFGLELRRHDSDALLSVQFEIPQINLLGSRVTIFGF